MWDSLAFKSKECFIILRAEDSCDQYSILKGWGALQNKGLIINSLRISFLCVKIETHKRQYKLKNPMFTSLMCLKASN